MISIFYFNSVIEHLLIFKLIIPSLLKWHSNCVNISRLETMKIFKRIMSYLMKGMVMNSKLLKRLIGLGILFLMFSTVNSAPKNELTIRFMKVLNLSSSSQIVNKLPGETQITPLFIRSSQKGNIDLTMLIAYNEKISGFAIQIVNKMVTPLIFSVSTMPFVNINFQPELLVFEQNGKRWSPSNHPDTIDMFPLEDDIPFGGPISDAQLHQGVIMLPGWFDINQPLEINYKNFRKMCLLR